MRPVTPGVHDFGKIVAQPHQIACWVDVLRNGRPIETGLPIIDGTVSESADDAIRASLNATIATPGRVAGSPEDILAPAGTELRVWKGVVLPDGAREAVALGTFPIQSSSLDGLGDETSVQAMDRSQMLIDDLFDDVREILAGSSVTETIRMLVLEAIPWAEIIAPTTDDATPQLVFSRGADRRQAISDLADSIGHVAFFDGLGRFTLKAVSTPSDTPALTIGEGEEGTLTDLGVSLTRDGYSSVTVVGTNFSGEPVSATAIDDDPNSPTYHGDPARRRDMAPIESETVSSEGMAMVQAMAELEKVRGITRSISWSAIPDPRLEVGDVVWFRRQTLGVSERHIIDSLSHPLGPEGQMSGTTRARQTT